MMDNPARNDPAREHRLARRRELYRLHRAAETPKSDYSDTVNTCAGDVQISIEAMCITTMFANSL